MPSIILYRKVTGGYKVTLCSCCSAVQCDRKPWSLFTIYCWGISQRYQRKDLVLVCNCVTALPHAVPCASSVSSPNLRCLSPDKRYPSQIRIWCPHPGQPEGKGSPLHPLEVSVIFLAVHCLPPAVTLPC